MAVLESLEYLLNALLKPSAMFTASEVTLHSEMLTGITSF